MVLIEDRWKKIWTLLEAEDDSDDVAGSGSGRCRKMIWMQLLEVDADPEVSGR